MAGSLLARGMLAGLLAAFLAVGFARVFGEPQVDRSIAFEDAADRARGDEPEPEIVSRPVQRGIGLLTGASLYGVGYGGLFAVVFCVALGRVGSISPRNLAALLALAGFIAVVLVPDLKYPPNPPAIGQPDTIGQRTALYFEMVVISLGAMALAGLAWSGLRGRLGGWNAALLGCAILVAIIATVQSVLPDVNEVSGDFPAVVLWRFREASIGMQIVLWGGLGLVFGPLAERRLARGQTFHARPVWN